MLVLIVVVAATTLAVFVAQYQQQLQAERAIQNAKNLEHLTVIHATPTLAIGGKNWSALNFSLGSLYINPSIVTEIAVNNQPLKQYSAWQINFSNGQLQQAVIGPGGQLTLGPHQEANVLVDFNRSSGNFSFYNASFVLATTDFVKIDIYTGLLNDFTRLFLPPTAIAVVAPLQTFNGTGFTTVPVLDGTNSFAGGNATLDSWTWTVSPDGLTAHGEKAVVAFNPIYSLHNITLVVGDSNGLLGTDTIQYTTP